METDPTRHSKSNADPHIIDLSAEEVRTIAPGEAEGTDEEVQASAETEPTAATTAAADNVDPNEKPAAEPRSQSVPPVGRTGTAQNADSGQQRNTAPRRSAGSLVATAFVAGVVVLAGAAGLQYWGVLPSMNADNKALDAVNSMTGEIGALKSDIAALKDAKPEVDLTPVNDKIAAIETRLADVPKANGLSVDADTRIAALNDQVSTLTKALADQKKASDDAQATLLMRVEAIEKKASEPRDDVEVAIAIASAGLKAAIDRGGSFTTELDTLAGIAPNDPAVTELRTFADIGVPSRSKLLADFPGVADQILAAVNTDDPNQSLTDRLLSSAFSAIKVRPVGEVEGEGADAIVARMEVKLTAGDLKGADAEWQKLPEPAKQASGIYEKSLSARIRVEDLVGGTLTRAVQGTETKG